MTDLKQISIPKPCHESWQQMTEANSGRHCQHCCKTVVDFTTMTDDGIINFLSATNNTCGRFGQDQLNSLNRQLYTANLQATAWWKRGLIAIGIISQASQFKAAAQSKPTSIQISRDTIWGRIDTQTTNHVLGKVVIAAERFRTLKGCITDDHSLPVPCATVKIPMTSYSTLTDQSGNFTLRVPANATQFSVNVVGYASQDVAIWPQDDNIYRISVEEQHALLAEVVLVRTPFMKRMYYKLIKRPNRKIFH
jgi:hypothetical protein